MTRGKAKPAQVPGDESDGRLGRKDLEEHSEMRQLPEVNLTTQQQKIVNPRSSTPSGLGSPDERPIMGRFGGPIPLPYSIVRKGQRLLNEAASGAPPQAMAPGGDDGIREGALPVRRDAPLDQEFVWRLGMLPL